MHTSSQLIERFGGAAKMAPQIDVPANTIRQWAARDSIPARYWHAIIEGAKKQNIRGVTAETLANLARRKDAA